MKYIIDTDPGIDDAFAIAIAYLSGLDIIGFTLTGGNGNLDSVTKNMKIIESNLNCNIKMYKGKEIKNGLYGKNDFGFCDFKDMNVEKVSAEDFIIESAKKYDNLSIICLGPLTNLAESIKKDRSILKKIKEVHIMGTSLDNNYSEFNVSKDPVSAQIVFSEQFNKLNVISHELAKDTAIDFPFKECVLKYNKENYGKENALIEDALLIASVINPNLIKFSKASVLIKDGKSFVKLGEGNVNYGISFNKDDFQKIFDILI